MARVSSQTPRREWVVILALLVAVVSAVLAGGTVDSDGLESGDEYEFRRSDGSWAGGYDDDDRFGMEMLGGGLGTLSLFPDDDPWPRGRRSWRHSYDDDSLVQESGGPKPRLPVRPASKDTGPGEAERSRSKRKMATSTTRLDGKGDKCGLPTPGADGGQMVRALACITTPDEDEKSEDRTSESGSSLSEDDSLDFDWDTDSEDGDDDGDVRGGMHGRGKDMGKAAVGLLVEQVIRPAVRDACEATNQKRERGTASAEAIRGLVPIGERPAGVCISPFFRERVVREVASSVIKSAVMAPLVHGLFRAAVNAVVHQQRPADIVMEVGSELRRSVLQGLAYGLTGGVASALLKDVGTARATSQVRAVMRGGRTTVGGVNLERLVAQLESQTGPLVRVGAADLVLREVSRSITTGAVSGLKGAINKLPAHPVIRGAMTALVSSIISAVISKVIVPRIARLNRPARDGDLGDTSKEKATAAALSQNTWLERAVATLLTMAVSKPLAEAVRPTKSVATDGDGIAWGGGGGGGGVIATGRQAYIDAADAIVGSGAGGEAQPKRVVYDKDVFLEDGSAARHRPPLHTHHRVAPAA